MTIGVRSITKAFGSFTALRDVSLEIPAGELVALLGPSGSGKTTLLRLIAGLETPDRGAVLFDGEDATSRHARDRHVGFVFQHYALFRHMTVFDNVAFGLRVRPRARRPSPAEIRARVTDLLRLVQLEWLADRYPAQLSGGQRQRIALARALAVRPRVLLLDEPFGALDAQVRKELRRWLRKLHAEIQVTSAFVTHDVDEALEVADRVVVMNEGRIEQVGTPEEVYERPANPFVFHFLGAVNQLAGRVHQGRARIEDAEFEVPEHAHALDVPAVLYVRPHNVAVERSRNGGAAIEAVVRRVHVIGAVVRLELERVRHGGALEAELSQERYRELGLKVEERVFVRFERLRVFLHQSLSALGAAG